MMMIIERRQWRMLMLLTLAAIVPACTYVNERRDLNAGGPQQREAAARAELDAERKRAAELTEQKSQREREMDEVNTRLASAQTALDDQNRRLEAALKAKKLSQVRYNELRRQADALKAETSNLRARNDSDRARKVSTPDPDKVKRLETLEQRRRDLETALQAAVAK